MNAIVWIRHTLSSGLCLILYISCGMLLNLYITPICPQEVNKILRKGEGEAQVRRQYYLDYKKLWPISYDLTIDYLGLNLHTRISGLHSNSSFSPT